MKTKTLIGFDMDMVLTDFEESIEILFKDKFPELKYKPAKECEFWEMAENYPEEYRSQIRGLYLNPPSRFYQNLKPKEGGIEAVKEIADFWNCEIAIVSTPIFADYVSCPEDVKKTYVYAWTRIVTEKAFWIEKHLGFLPSFIPIKDKRKFAGDFLIDDNPLFGVGKSRIPTWQHLLYDEDYLFNRDSKAIKINWSNWREVLSLVHEREF